MTDPKPKHPHMIVKALNATPLSQHLASLLRQEKVELWANKLIVLHLLEWALENLAADQYWAQAVDQSASMAAASDPEAVYQNLVSPHLEEAATLREAGLAILSEVVDLIPPGSSPA